jgi:hypothetical protein
MPYKLISTAFVGTGLQYCTLSYVTIALLHRETSSAGFGTQELNGNTCLTFNEHQSKWFKFTAGCSAPSDLQLAQLIIRDDYDFALFNVTGGCPTPTTPAIACNYYGNNNPEGLHWDQSFMVRGWRVLIRPGIKQMSMC